MRTNTIDTTILVIRSQNMPNIEDITRKFPNALSSNPTKAAPARSTTKATIAFCVGKIFSVVTCRRLGMFTSLGSQPWMHFKCSLRFMILPQGLAYRKLCAPTWLDACLQRQVCLCLFLWRCRAGTLGSGGGILRLLLLLGCRASTTLLCRDSCYT